jgi:hypothetical protein
MLRLNGGKGAKIIIGSTPRDRVIAIIALAMLFSALIVAFTEDHNQFVLRLIPRVAIAIAFVGFLVAFRRD